MADRQEEKVVACGAPCGKCRDCNPIISMAERVDAYSSARSLIKEIPRHEDDPISAQEVIILANWLYYGGSPEDES